MKSYDTVEVPAALGLGPMSRNAVDAALCHAYRRRRRLMLIASRRQIEGDAVGGGYVEGWTTEELAAYVRARDPEGRLMLCRDHGGPWQHPGEQDMDEPRAMAACLESFRRDIAAGFDLLHIDTSVEGTGEAAFEPAVDRLVTLYGECWRAATRARRPIRFEIGFEGQGIDAGDPREFAQQLQVVIDRLKAESLPAPTFVVAQTGTKVVESGNIGALVQAPKAVLHTIGGLAEVCAAVGAGLKAHNADYLPDEVLRSMMEAGVAAVNIAPELGVVETRTMLRVLCEAGEAEACEAFLEMAFTSGAWGRWVRPDTALTDEEKAVLAGHYVYMWPAWKDRRAAAAKRLARLGIDLDAQLRSAIGARVGALLNSTAAFPVPVAAAGPELARA